MPKPNLSLLSKAEIHQIHEASLQILSKTGTRIHNLEICRHMVQAGIAIDLDRQVMQITEDQVMQALNLAGKQFRLYGRSAGQSADFGYGKLNFISSPGQFSWFDYRTWQRRPPMLADAAAAGRVGDALENITIVGGMAVPADVPEGIRDVVLTATLLKQTSKPVRAFPVSRRSSHYVLEIFKAVAGGSQALRERPMVEMLLEPISPLQLPGKELDILLEFVAYGQPISIGPMAMASGSAPATLAGTLAQENAEILAALVVVQAIAPGTPILYGSIPHILDPRSSICSFGSPEQGLMALALTEIGKSYGFPVYINVNLTDSKRLDLQAGLEKMGSLELGMLAEADLFGHAGILGPDHGGCLSWLVADNAAAGFARRILTGFPIDEERLATDVIGSVGPGGNYLSEEHTLCHYRKELWLPDRLWTRATYDRWVEEGSTDFAQRAANRVDEILSTHQPAPIDPDLEREIDAIVAAARRELLG